MIFTESNNTQHIFNKCSKLQSCKDSDSALTGGRGKTCLVYLPTTPISVATPYMLRNTYSYGDEKIKPLPGYFCKKPMYVEY